VIADLSPAASVDTAGTSALGPLHRLRGQCRAAKERLSGTTVTSLTAELPGFRGEVRVTRTELDEQIRKPLAEFVGVLAAALDRNSVHAADLVAVASIGGGARIPILTTTLSERFRVPVVTTARPELAAATGAALRVAWGPADDRSTAIAPAFAATATVAAAAFADADAGSSTFRALAWSEAHDVPPVVPPAEPLYDEPLYDEPLDDEPSARPQLEFAAADEPLETALPPWYRRSSTLVGVAASVALLLATSAVVAFGSSTSPASNTTPLAPSTTAQAPGAAPPPNIPAQAGADDPPLRTVYVNPAPATQYQAPAPQEAVAPPPEAPQSAPSSEVPPPPPPVTTTVTATTEAPPSTTTVTASPSPTTQPPVSQPPSQTPAPSSTAQPPVTMTIPQIPSVPGVLNPPHNR
jgi:Hsp70 protein